MSMEWMDWMEWVEWMDRVSWRTEFLVDCNLQSTRLQEPLVLPESAELGNGV